MKKKRRLNLKADFISRFLYTFVHINHNHRLNCPDKYLIQIIKAPITKENIDLQINIFVLVDVQLIKFIM